MDLTVNEINSLLELLYPICRSITGNGNRESLNALNEIVSLNIKEYPSGMNVFDWQIPDEWNIHDAWIKNSKGVKIVDFKISNLHVLNYSVPVGPLKINYTDLKSHLFFDINQPDVIPYKTSYYNKNWGFCLSYNDFLLYFKENQEYEIFIDSCLEPGSLTLADYKLKGSNKEEYIFSTYFCHPSLANDNLSGVVANIFIARELSKLKLRNSYRFLFCPETIGSITYLYSNRKELDNLVGGFVLTCVGGESGFSYKNSFLGDHKIDIAVRAAFNSKNIQFSNYEFVPQGSDERQYSSPGFRIPVGSIHRDKYNEYKEYHTSADNLDFISAQSILETIEMYLKVVEILESDVKFISNNPYCEPKLDKYNLYPTIGRTFKRFENSIETSELDITLWLMFFGDGENSLLQISAKLNINYDELKLVFDKLVDKGLLSIISLKG